MEKAPVPAASRTKVRLGEEVRAVMADPFASRVRDFTRRGEWNRVEDASI
jgi:hypothetical protein